MLDDADIPAVFALVVLCLVQFAPAIPAVLLSAAGGVLTGAALCGAMWGIRRVTAMVARHLGSRHSRVAWSGIVWSLTSASPPVAFDGRALALLGAAVLIGCRAPAR